MLIQVVLQVETVPDNDYENTKLVQASLVRAPSYCQSVKCLLTTGAELSNHPSVASNGSPRAIVGRYPNESHRNINCRSYRVPGWG